MSVLEGRTCVVAGNGHSLTSIAPGRVLTGDAVMRTNNFFFERAFYLGRRVDLAYIAGDPRVVPFMFETLHRCRDQYEIGAWTSHNPKVIKAGMRRFRDLYRPMRFRDAAIERGVADLVARYQRKPMSGTYAVLAAHGLGARHILLAGMDLYTGGPRYPFTPGRHFQTLMAPGMAAMGPDKHLHNADLDRSIFEMLLARGDVRLERTTEQSALDDVLPLAPIRDGQAIEALPRPNPVNDWVDWAGPYPIALLKTLRRASALRRRLLGRPPTP
ncbi:hypothetical protein [Aquicoccus porphyridii]|uniref:hypothetical protein n=1 Tax=Aquicoccus porphyridii TaxID=1852029 RepID=UPI001FEA3A02|nr:hypothetical protein [Aquicoccus porphyridii]